MYAIVNESNEVVYGPREWAVGLFGARLAELGLSASLPQTPAASRVVTVGPYRIFPVVEIKPSFDARWEELTGPVLDIQASEITSTYGKQNLVKANIFNARLDEVWDKRDAVLQGGWVAGGGNTFVTRYYDILKFVTTMVVLNDGAGGGPGISESAGDLTELIAWRTDGASRAMDTEAGVRSGVVKLYRWFRDIEATAKGHITNLTILRDDTSDSWDLDYVGPGHGAPYSAQELAEYDITVSWPS